MVSGEVEKKWSMIAAFGRAMSNGHCEGEQWVMRKEWRRGGYLMASNRCRNGDSG